MLIKNLKNMFTLKFKKTTLLKSINLYIHNHYFTLHFNFYINIKVYFCNNYIILSRLLK